jgi:hypothetical protein
MSVLRQKSQYHVAINVLIRAIADFSPAEAPLIDNALVVA